MAVEVPRRPRAELTAATLEREAGRVNVELSDRLADLGQTAELVAMARRLERKAAALDRLAGAHGMLNLTEAAKVLKVKPRRLLGWLEGHGWIFRTDAGELRAHQARLDSGHLVANTIDLYRVEGNRAIDGSIKIGVQVFVTGKGLRKLAVAFDAEERS